MLGRQLCAIGEYQEAAQWASGPRARRRGDVLGGNVVAPGRGAPPAHRSEYARAEQTAREAVEIIERTDGLNYQGDAYADLADVLMSAGRGDEAAQALEQALERYARKKNLAMVAQVRPRLKELRAARVT